MTSCEKSARVSKVALAFCIELRNDRLSLYISIHQQELSRTKFRNEYSSIFSLYVVDVFLIYINFYLPLSR